MPGRGKGRHSAQSAVTNDTSVGGSLPAGIFVYRIPSVEDILAHAGRIFAYRISSVEDIFPMPGVFFRLLHLVWGAFRAPCRICPNSLGIPSPRGTFVNSDKSTQKRRNPYGLDPLCVPVQVPPTASYSQAGRYVQRGRPSLELWSADCRALVGCIFL